MRRGGGYRAAWVLAGALALAGCARSVSDGPGQPTAPPPTAGATALAPPVVPEPQSRASTLGVMPPDVLARMPRPVLPFLAVRPRIEPPYSNAQLLRNFMSIALRAEAADDVDLDGGIAISKWENPIRYRLSGAQTRDRVQIAAFAQHLSLLTGLEIREAREVERHNMDIRFVPPHQRGAEMQALLATQWLGPQVARLATGWRDRERDRCFALTTRDPRSGVTGTAHVFIKDELPLIWRETCIIEEMTQSLGLLNDDPRAAPSIFNDDGVYLALTSHDEMLLRILYDRRIRSGMRRQMVFPMVERIIADLRPLGGRPVGLPVAGLQ